MIKLHFRQFIVGSFHYTDFSCVPLRYIFCALWDIIAPYTGFSPTPDSISPTPNCISPTPDSIAILTYAHIVHVSISNFLTSSFLFAYKHFQSFKMYKTQSVQNNHTTLTATVVFRTTNKMASFYWTFQISGKSRYYKRRAVRVPSSWPTYKRCDWTSRQSLRGRDLSSLSCDAIHPMKSSSGLSTTTRPL